MCTLISDGDVLHAIGVVQPREEGWLGHSAAVHVHLSQTWWDVVLFREVELSVCWTGGLWVKGRARYLRDGIKLVDRLGVLHPGKDTVQGHHIHVIQCAQPQKEAASDGRCECCGGGNGGGEGGR